MSSEVSNPIENTSIYNGRMVRSLMDKIFFVDKIDADCIVDFGCGDGSVLKALSPWIPGTILVGIDNNREMILKARQNLKDCFSLHPRIEFFETLKQTIDAIEVLKVTEKIKSTVLNLSSVIHEVYNYSSLHDVGGFWNDIWNPICNKFDALHPVDSRWDYIVIRDMVPNRSIDRPSDPSDIARVYRKFLNTKEFKEFESHWGSIESNKNLVHFLLKYRYLQPNWAREVRENYLPIYREDLLAMIPEGYEVVYHEHYVLPFIRRVVFEDFGIVLKDPTHFKLILKRV